jgi:raffinose/stachyose/melibiose transport system substrate-binding protein
MLGTTGTRAKRRLAGIAVAAVAAMILGACAGSGGSEAAKPASAKQTITFWTWLPTKDQFRTLQSEFAKKYPNITIKWSYTPDFANYQKKLQVALASGEGPDLFGTQVGSMLDQYERFTAPMAPLADKHMPGWKDKIASNAVNQTKASDGTQVAMPIIGAGMEYYLYNKTLLAENGITSLPTNYAELKADTATLKSKNLISMAMGAKDGWHNEDFYVWLSQQFGPGDIYKAEDGKLPWTSPSLVDSLNAWKKLFTDGIFEKGALGVATYPDARDSYFYARKSAYFPTGSWHVSATIPNPETPGTKVEKDELGMARFPQIGPKPAVATTSVDLALAINKQSPHQAAAMQFVKFMTLDQGQQIFVNTLQGSPVNKDIHVQLPTGATDVARKSVELITAANTSAEFGRKLKYPAIDTALQVALQEVVSGKSAEDALKDVQKASDAVKR